MYISSTFQDLEEARRQVSQTVRRMQHTDVAMEYYGAEDVRPLDKCLADVAACDLYICVVAWRYGFVPDGESRSITELEYLQAVESGKPRLLFLLSEAAPWPMNRAERSPEAMDRLAEFRSSMERDRVVDKFMNEQDLSKKVGEAIHRWEREQGGPRGMADWETYRRAVFDAHRWVRLAVIAGAKQDRSFAQIPLTDVFVPQPVQGGSPEYEVTSPQGEPGEALDDAEADEAAEMSLGTATGASGAPVEQIQDVLARERRQVFLGAPGSGKSTLLLDAMLQLCDTGRGPDDLPANLRHAPLPFLIELRQYVLDPATSFVDYIAANVGRRYGVRVDAEQVRAVLTEPDRAVVMFDGLDEVFDPRTQSEVIEEFRQFSRMYGGCRVVVTSRIAGYSALELERDEFRHYTVLGFGMPEVREFVPKWYTYYTWQGDERDAQGLIRRISESPRLLELAGNPLLLTMMAVIYKHHDLPEKRLQLYKRCTEVLLEDWEVKRKKISRDESLPLGFPMVAEQKAELLQQVSMYMLEHQRAGSELNAIAREPLLDIIAAYLQSEYHKSPGEARAVASEILDHLRERTYVIAEVGERRFGFVHRTFMEFYAALHCKAEFNRREADYDWLTRELFGAHWRKSEWREVLLLLIAMLKEQESPVRKVIEHVRAEEAAGLPIQLAFAARCLAEVGTNDDAWSRQLVHDLVDSIRSAARQTESHAVTAFLDDTLGSFSVLASTVTLRKTTRKIVDDLGKANPLRGRIIAFQLQLALRSKEERRAFALESLTDKEESVRRGAIAALEREWPGREDVAAALAEVLRNDRISRVRMSALQALDRSWPESTAVLDALEDRARVETAYTVITHVARYLARGWAGNLRALRVLLRFCGSERRVRNLREEGQVVRDALVESILDGWRHDPRCREILREFWLNAEDRNRVGVALIALASGWSNDTETREWVLLQIDEAWPMPAWPSLAISSIRAMLHDGEAKTWVHEKAEDVEISDRLRQLIIAQLEPHGCDEETLDWLEGRLVREPAPNVRLEVMRAWQKGTSYEVRKKTVLAERVLNDPAAWIRVKALEMYFRVASDDEQRHLASLVISREIDQRGRGQILRYIADWDAFWVLPFVFQIFSGESHSMRIALMQSFAFPGNHRFAHDTTGAWVDLHLFAPGWFDPVKEDGRLRLDWRVRRGRWIRRDYAEQVSGFLADVATNDPDVTVRSLAVTGLMGIAPSSSEARAILMRRGAEEKSEEIREGIVKNFEFWNRANEADDRLHPGNPISEGSP
ncbi:DUF4062 domain-containing protein [Streptomyces sp. NBC_01373]|uniref:DUF4062 domain-containing protein n=1 Tax=Streptomyces sp. NBC_01373 TaxID=2903843 RepID=UPI00225AC9D0|nr:DUF4062 domain-containing protein [Streptomyces sp. NBC_01373]MCX4704654.1 DUF4062 domain-containing protein [Streptomyces sp. NBC_01373]